MASAEVHEVLVRLRADAAEYSGAVNEARGLTQRFGAEVSKIGTGLSVAIGIVATAGIYKFSKAIKEASATAQLIEKTRQQFTTLTGSVGSANYKIDQFLKLGKTQPFATDSVLAAARSMEVLGGSTYTSTKNMRLLMDAAAGTGTDLQNVATWVSRAYAVIQDGQPIGRAALRLQYMGVVTPKTVAEVKKLQKEGASASQVWNVFSADIARFNGSAAKLGTTFAGMKIILHQTFVGATEQVIKPFMHLLLILMQTLTTFATSPAFQHMVDAITRWGTNISATILKVTNNFKNIGNIFGPFNGVLKTLTANAAGASIPLAALFATVLSHGAQAIPILGSMVPKLGLLSSLFIGLAVATPAGRQGLHGIAVSLAELGKSLAPIGQQFIAAVQQITASLLPVVPTIIDAVKSMVEAFANFVPVIVALIPPVTTIIKWLAELLKAIAPLAPAILIAAGAMALFTKVAAISAGTTAAGAGASLFTRLTAGAIGAGKALIGIGGAMKTAFTAANTGQRYVGGFVSGLSGIGAAAKAGFSGLITAIGPALIILASVAAVVGSIVWLFGKMKAATAASQKSIGGDFLKGFVDTKGQGTGALTVSYTRANNKALTETRNAYDALNAGLITELQFVKEVARVNGETTQQVKDQTISILKQNTASLVSKNNFKEIAAQWRAMAPLTGNQVKLMKELVTQQLIAADAAKLQNHDLSGFAGSWVSAIQAGTANIKDFAIEIKNAGLSTSELKRVLSLIPNTIKKTLAFQILIDPAGAIKQLQALNAKLAAQLSGLSAPTLHGADVQNVALTGQIAANNKLIADLTATVGSSTDTSTKGDPTGGGATDTTKASVKQLRVDLASAAKQLASFMTSTNAGFKKLTSLNFGVVMASRISQLDQLFQAFASKLGDAVKNKILPASALTRANTLGSALAKLSARFADLQSRIQAMDDAIASGIRAGTDIVGQFSGLGDTAKSARTSVADLQNQMQAIVSSGHASADAVLRYIDLSHQLVTARQQENAQILTGKHLLDEMHANLNDAKAFSAALIQLAKQGLNKGLLQQLAAAGPTALPLIKAIQQAGVKNVNSIQAQIDALIPKTQSSVNWSAFGSEMTKLKNETISLTRKLGELIYWLRRIGHFASGGVATHPQLAFVAEREAEAIIPLSKIRQYNGTPSKQFVGLHGGGGINVYLTVMGSVGVDDIVEQVRKAVLKIKLHNGSSGF